MYKLLFKCCVFVLVGVGPVLHAQLGPDPVRFFAAAPEAPASLSETEYYPAGKNFLFSFFSVGAGVNEEGKHAALPEDQVQQEFRRYREAGLDTMGPQYEMNDRAREDARQHGLKLIYMLRYPINFHVEGGGRIEVNPKEVREGIRELMKEVVEDDNISIWYLHPEELRPWRKNEMQFLEAASRAIREFDPLKRPIWIYDPAHSTAGRLASIAPWVDYLGKGMYTNYASKKDSRIWVRWSMEQQIEAIRRAESQTTPLAVPELFYSARRGPFPEEDFAKVADWVRHDLYLSLACGAKGVVVFSARKRPAIPDEVWESYYSTYLQVADELRGEKQLANVFLFGEERQDIQVDVLEGPERVELLYPSGGVKEPIDYPSVTHLDVAYGNHRYLLLVNSANEPVRVMAGGFPYAAVRAESLLDGREAFDVGEGEFETELAPLEVQFYRISQR